MADQGLATLLITERCRCFFAAGCQTQIRQDSTPPLKQAHGCPLLQRAEKSYDEYRYTYNDKIMLYL